MTRPGISVVIARSVAALLAGIFFGSSLCYGWGSGHGKITQAALDSLPEWQRARWRESEAGFQKYCVYVDMGLDSAEAKPCLVVVNKRLFHYFPRDNREDYLVFMEGAERVRLIVDKLREGEDAEAAKFAGAFAHVLEDLSQPQCHALEGINGMPWTVLDELFTPQDQSWNRAPQSIISLDSDPRFVVRLDGYRPQLLGEREVVLPKGIGTGCCRFSYEIPAGVFQEFRCTAGLHSQLGLHPSGAKLRLTVRFGGKNAFESGVLEAGSPAQKTVIPVAAGGTLEFVSEGHPGQTGNEANHAVWGESVLIRLDRVEAAAGPPVKPPSAKTRDAEEPRRSSPHLPSQIRDSRLRAEVCHRNRSVARGFGTLFFSR